MTKQNEFLLEKIKDKENEINDCKKNLIKEKEENKKKIKIKEETIEKLNY